jgi:hypothetical protein
MKVEERPKIVVNFAVKVGNSDTSFNQEQPKSSPEIPVPELEPQKEPEVKKEEPPKPKKNPEKKKAEKKVVKKPEKPKTQALKPNDDKKKKQKADEKKPIVKPDFTPQKDKIAPQNDKKQEKKEEIKPEVKEEAKPEEVEEETAEQEQEEIEEDSSQDYVGARDLQTIDLSTREKFNIQSQIKRCYRKAIGETENDSKVTINIHVVIDKDGSIDLDSASIKDYEKYNDPKEVDFHIAVDNVRRALSFCSPLRNLPSDKYDVWREVDLRFDDDMTQENQ